MFFWSFFVSSFGLGLYNYIWPVFLKDLDAHANQVGIVFSVGFLALAASTLAFETRNL